MSEDQSSQASKRGWLAKLSDAFSAEIRDRDQVLQLLQEAHENELLDNSAYHIMQGAIEVSDQHARDTMIPRSQMVVIEPGDTVTVILDKIVQSSHSRFPVMNEDNTAVVGILLAKDLLGLAREADFDVERMTARIGEVIRPPVFVPESKRLNRLLRDFRETRNHMAIVVDEYGGVAGLVTIEDVLEEIVGDIEDEHDPLEEEDIQELGEGRYRVSALTEVDDFNDYFQTELSDEEFDTIGGYVTHVFGHLPRRGEAVTIANWHFVVHMADDRRIRLLDVSRAGRRESLPELTPHMTSPD
ncbi:MAG: CBS domain-containing protein [Natronospirillum sp.]|uniref:HlyC/CorC family transporter n=1 Tax=Natronospirillum sp. TaxID=2812955 RepID=UPI0025F037A3|nr:transporter associated domain-containing protein [Natronospirillum sp.]MCH8551953.1 CBS domain-containing protein [Natronospirillum sp.]